MPSAKSIRSLHAEAPVQKLEKRAPQAADAQKLRPRPRPANVLPFVVLPHIQPPVVLSIRS